MQILCILFLGIFYKSLFFRFANTEKCTCTYKAGMIMINCHLDNKKAKLPVCLNENEKFIKKIEAIIIKCNRKVMKKNLTLNLSLKFIEAYSLYVTNCGDTEVFLNLDDKTGILTSKEGNLVSFV